MKEKTYITELQERAREKAGKIVLTPEHDGYSFTPNALDDIVATTALRTLEEVEEQWESHTYRNWRDTIKAMKDAISNKE